MFKLKEDEHIIMKDIGCSHGSPDAPLGDELILTNQRVIVQKKGFFGKVKDVKYFPVNRIVIDKNSNKAAIVEKRSLLSSNLVVHFNSGVEYIGFNSKKLAHEFIEHINILLSQYSNEEKTVTADVFNEEKKKKGFFKRIGEHLSDPEKLIETAQEKIEIASEEKRSKLFEKSLGTEILVIDRQNSKSSYSVSENVVDRFDVFDGNQILKYTVMGKRYSRKRQLEVFNTIDKDRIGFVKEKLFAPRIPFTFQSSPVDFSIEMNGQKLGKIKSKGGIVNRKFKVGFTGWQIKGNFITGNYSIFMKKEEIAKVNRKGVSYILTFYESSNELLLLMIVLALYSDASQDKTTIKKQTKRRRRSLFFPWL